MRYVKTLMVIFFLATYVSATSITDSLLNQIYQVLDDMFNFFSKDVKVCQVLIDDNSTFSSPEINRRTYYMDYTYDEYLMTGTYYSKVRCIDGGRASMWSQPANFTHFENASVYVSWTQIS